MLNTSQSTQTISPLIQSNPIASIQQFFNGDSIEKIRSDMDNLQNTTITESYGDLDKEDKWLLIDFLRRISNLIEAAHVLITKSDNPEITSN